MPCFPAPWIRICPEALTYRRPLRSPSHEPSSTEENGEEEIFPDPLSESMAESWRSSAANALERKYAALVAAETAHRK